MFNNVKLHKLLAVTLAMILCLSVFAACGEAQTPETEPSVEETIPPIQVESAEELAEQRSFLLSAGESAQLTLAGEGVSLASSNPNVATVDESGKITAVAKGTAMITVSYEDMTDYCGVIVDMQGEMIDISGMTANVIFSDVRLNSQTKITGMTYSNATETVYYAQPYATSSYAPQDADIILTKVSKNGETWECGSWMRFYESGTGYLGLDHVNGKDLLWLESGGSIYGTGVAISRVEWEDEAFLRTSYGETFTLQDIQMPAVTADSDNGLLLVMDQTTGTYAIYDRDALLAGESAVALHYIDCASRQTPAAGTDDSQGRYNASLRGFALYNGYIYQISGNSSIYVSVFDLNGVLQYAHRLTDYPELPLRMPAGIAVVDGVVYVTIQSGDTACHLANLWEYKK